jgi:hypothetical protein
VATGSAERRKRTAPQRHFPRRVVMGVYWVGCR